MRRGGLRLVGRARVRARVRVRVLARVLALTLTCAVALAAPGFAQAPVGELVEKARAKLAGGRADAAIDLLETALRRAPEREDAQRLLAAACSRHGVEAHDRGDLDLAGRRFARALELFPDEPVLLQSFGTIRMRQGRADDAKRIMTRLLGIDARNVEAHVVLAQIAADRGELQNAREHYEAAARLAPGRPELEQAADRFRRDAEVEQGFIVTRHGDFLIQRRRLGVAEEAVRTVSAMLFEAHAELKRNLGDRPGRPITVVLYSDEEFRRVNTAGHWAGAWYDGRIRVPVGDFPREQRILRQMLRHELCHAFLRTLHPKTPLWVHEGYAQLFEGKSPEDAQRTLRAQGDRWLAPELFVSGFAANGNEVVVRQGYEESLAAVGWLLRYHSTAKFRDLVTRLGSGTETEAALQAVYGFSLEQLRTNLRE